MLMIASRATVLNRAWLETRRVPKRLLDLGVVLYPRRGIGGALFWRAVFEKALPRYLVALAPFPLILLVRPDLALGMSQAPLPMFAVVLFVETYVLAIPNREARRRLIAPAEAARALDRLGVRAREVLARIAARRGLAEGTLHLVVEQSGLARVPPLTVVSVQAEGPEPGFLDLDAAERAMLEGELFAEGLSERLLHRVNLAENVQFRSFAFDARGVSAHARLAAMAGG